MANLLFVEMITMSLNVVDVENKSVLKHMSSGVATSKRRTFGTSSFKSSMTTEAGILKLYTACKVKIESR